MKFHHMANESCGPHRESIIKSLHQGLRESLVHEEQLMCPVNASWNAGTVCLPLRPCPIVFRLVLICVLYNKTERKFNTSMNPMSSSELNLRGQ